MSFSSVGTILPKFNQYLNGADASACIEKMFQANSKGKVVVKFFSKAVKCSEWETNASFRSLLDRVVSQSSKLGKKQKAKFEKVASVFHKKAKKIDGKATFKTKEIAKKDEAQPDTRAKLETLIRDTLNKLTKKDSSIRQQKEAILSGFDGINEGFKKLQEKQDLIQDLRRQAQNAINQLPADSGNPSLNLLVSSLRNRYENSERELSRAIASEIASIKDDIKAAKRMLKSADTDGNKTAKLLYKQVQQYLDLSLQEKVLNPVS